MTAARIVGAIVPLIFCAVIVIGAIWYTRHRKDD